MVLQETAPDVEISEHVGHGKADAGVVTGAIAFRANGALSPDEGTGSAAGRGGVCCRACDLDHSTCHRGSQPFSRHTDGGCCGPDAP